MNKFFTKIGIGTWEMTIDDQNPTDDDLKEAMSLYAAINSGYTHIDTSSFYKKGKMEQLVGQAIKSFKRDEYFLSSKVLLELDYDGVIRNCEESLKRLGVDYLDVYYAHGPNHEIPVDETTKAFNRLMDQGLIKHAGVCNATVETIDSYHQRLNGGVFATQAVYNLIIREPAKKGVIDYCNKNGIHFIAYRCLQLPVPSLNIVPVYKVGTYPMLDEIAKKYDKNNTEISIQWLLQQDKMNILVKSNALQMMLQHGEIFNFTLTDEEMKILSDDFPNQQDEGIYLDGRKMPLR